MDWAEGTKVRINCGTRALGLQFIFDRDSGGYIGVIQGIYKGIYRVYIGVIYVGRIGMYGDAEWLSGTGSYLEKRV